MIVCGLKEEAYPFISREISAIMTINHHIMGTYTLRFEKFCRVFSSHLTEFFMTFVT